MPDIVDETAILVRLKTACFSLEQAILVARMMESGLTPQLERVLKELDALYAEIGANRQPNPC